jgi:dolichol-phosphate mannosyltransferase
MAECAVIYNQQSNTKSKMFLSLVLPTLNEAANLERMVHSVHSVLAPFDYEILVSDDNSPDATGRIADQLASSDPRIRVLHRSTSPGLSPAVAEAWQIARGDVLAVMDADLQHPPEVIARVAQAVYEGADLVIASRYVSGGNIPAWTIHRRFLSLLGTSAVRVVLGPKVKGVSDPLSGCFAFRRSSLDPHRLHPDRGFKILLEVLARGDFHAIREVPYQFATRTGGNSKLTLAVALRDIRYVLRLAAETRGKSQ